MPPITSLGAKFLGGLKFHGGNFFDHAKMCFGHAINKRFGTVFSKTIFFHYRPGLDNIFTFSVQIVTEAQVWTQISGDPWNLEMWFSHFPECVMVTFECCRQFREGSPLGRDISTQTLQKTRYCRLGEIWIFFDFQVPKRLTSDESISEIFSVVLEDPSVLRVAKLF